jgi:hypothetical protein
MVECPDLFTVFLRHHVSVPSLKFAEIMRSACGAGDSIKPGVERSGTPGRIQEQRLARDSGRQSVRFRIGQIIKQNLERKRSGCRPRRGLTAFADSNLGFRYAPPQALCCRLLRRLVVISARL